MIIDDNPKTHIINVITNPNSDLVAAKFSFFADCLDFMIAHCGEFTVTEMENHYSVVDFLIFIIEHRIKDSKSDNRISNSIEFVKWHLNSHYLLKKGDDFIDNYYDDAPSLVQKIDSTNYKKDVGGLKEILSDLKELSNYLSNKYIENATKALNQLIQCKHTLYHHRQHIDYIAQRVFTYFYLEGYTKKVISNLVNKLLQNKVVVQGDGIFAESPLPKSLYKRLIEHNRNRKPYDKVLQKDLEEYFNKRDLKQQIEGIENLSNYEKNTYTFYFKIDNIILHQEEFTLSGIKFLSTKKFKEYYGDGIKYFKEFFESTPFPACFALMKVKAYNQKKAIALGKRELLKVLHRLKEVLKRECYLNQSGYVTNTYDRTGYFWVNSFTERAIVYDDTLRRFENRKLNFDNISFNSFINELNEMFEAALGESDENESLKKYWKVCEKIGQCSTEDVKCLPGSNKTISVMALLCEQIEDSEFRLRLSNRALNYVLNSRFNSPEELGLTPEKLEELSNLKILRSVRFFNKEINHPYVNYMLNRGIRFRSIYSEKEVMLFYLRIFSRLSSFRNAYEHNGMQDEKIASQIKVSVHIIIDRVRGLLIREMRKNPNECKNINELLNSLILKGKVDLLKTL